MMKKRDRSRDSEKGGDRISFPGRRQFLKAAATGALGAGIAPAAVAAAGVPAQSEFPQPKSNTKRIEVDFSKIIGTIKTVNGVNGGPLAEFNLSSSFSEIGVPHVRLHDIPYMFLGRDVVDVGFIFPDPAADVDDPKSYDFEMTDYYIHSIRAIGAEITYRLAYETWGKHNHHPHSTPPRDYARWAEICSHIVRHYNQGWANGFQNIIKFWEVWNEPDIHEFWSGTPEEYYRLYEVTAKALKKTGPETKVGGPTQAIVTNRKFLDGFLKHCADHEVPLDFASWHTYAKQPSEIISHAAIVHDALQKYGFTKTESILDEWNYFPGKWDREEKEPEYRKWLFETQVGGPAGAAFSASVLIGLQDTTVGLADYYQGTTHYFGGLFDEFGAPRKPFYAFKAFKAALETPQRVSASGSEDSGFAVLAGLSKDKSEATVLIGNFGSECNRYDIAFRGLPWKQSFAYEKYVVDSNHNFDLAMKETIQSPTLGVSEEVETPSVCLLRLRAAGG
jgi:xylan 1,4-beta-xylosidase